MLEDLFDLVIAAIVGFLSNKVTLALMLIGLVVFAALAATGQV